MALTLAAALGHPAPWVSLPSRRSASWAKVLEAFSNFLNGCELTVNFGPHKLWNRLQRRPRPKNIRWGEVLKGWEEAHADRVREALFVSHGKAEIYIMSWNACWLVDMKSDKVRRKREIIESALARGNVVCLQETHWTDGDAKLWLLGLLAGRAYFSNSIERDEEADDDGH